jgi:hypothetical protein
MENVSGGGGLSPQDIILDADLQTPQEIRRAMRDINFLRQHYEDQRDRAKLRHKMTGEIMPEETWRQINNTILECYKAINNLKSVLRQYEGDK